MRRSVLFSKYLQVDKLKEDKIGITRMAEIKNVLKILV